MPGGGLAVPSSVDEGIHDSRGYTDLRKFVELSEKLSRGPIQGGNRSAPIAVLKQLIHVHKLPIEELQECFFALRDAAFTYTYPAYKLPKSTTPLFSDDDLSAWRKIKNLMKKLIKQHQEPMLRLKECQQNCWHSRDKVKQYASMLEAAKISLPYYVDNMAEYKDRIHSIKGLKKDLSSRQKKHMKNVSKYQELLNVESAIRMEIYECGNKLQKAITQCISRQIEKALANLQRVCPPEIRTVQLDCDGISSRLYEITSKNYVFKEPPADMTSAEFNVALVKPKLEPSFYNYGDYDSTYASHNYFGTVIETNEVDENRAYYLPLETDDTVKLKIVSRDNRTGFGWTKQSKLSMKKWGFFQVSNINLVPLNKENN